MSLVRNLTRRARAHTRGEESSSSSSTMNILRSRTVRYTPGTINRAKISLPTELISTTNVQALTAPDIRKVSSESASSSSSSVHSTSGNDYFSGFDYGFMKEDSNSSSSDLSPNTPITPISDGESTDFFASKLAATVAATPTPAPAIPQRAPSHSKRAHVELSRQRSFKRSMSPPPSDLRATQSSSSLFYDQGVTTTKPLSSDLTHPFTAELAQVNEVAEEFGAILDEEEQEMLSKGLCKFTVRDYIHEISGGIYEDQLGLNPWI